MRHSHAIIATACLVMAAAPAFGQRVGTRLGRDATAEDASEALDIVAECSFERRPAFARKLLSTLPGSPEESKAFQREVDDLGMVCMDNDRLVMDGMQLRFKAHLMRWRFALLAIRGEWLKQWPASLPQAKDKDPWFMPALSALPAGAEVNRAVLTLQDFGHCVAVSDWDGTRKFLSASDGSPEEKAAVKQLLPVLGPCLSKDVSLKLTPNTLRTTLAEPVYHILVPSAVPVLTAAK